MPFLINLGNVVSSLSPFRKTAIPVSPKRRAAAQDGASFKTPRQPHDPAANYPTPEIEASTKRKRSLVSTGRSSPFGGLLTPASVHDAASTSPSQPHKKRQRLSTAPVETIERDHLQGQSLPKSGATKPAAYHPEQVSPSAWKQERNERLAEVRHLRSKGWRESDIALFRKISLRGFEPLLPAHWRIDFNNLPGSLFTRKLDQAYVKTLEQNPRQACNLRATKALWSLIELGAQVRDDILLGLQPHRRIARVFKHCLDWVLDDANLRGKRGVLPLAVISSAPTWVNAVEIQAELNQKLARLADAWRAQLKPGCERLMPPLYGIVVSHAVWAIVSYVPGGKSRAPEKQHDPDNFSTLMNTFKWTTAGQEVWVAFAFAIFAIHCRDELIETLDSGLVPAYDGSFLPARDDPDK